MAYNCPAVDSITLEYHPRSASVKCPLLSYFSDGSIYADFFFIENICLDGAPTVGDLTVEVSVKTTNTSGTTALPLSRRVLRVTRTEATP